MIGYRAAVLAAATALTSGVAHAQFAPSADKKAPAPALDADLHAAYLAVESLQLERPTPEEATREPPAGRPAWLRWLLDLLGGGANLVGPILRIVFWVGLAAALGALLWFMFRDARGIRLIGARRARAGGPEDDVLADIRPDAAAARTLLEDADRLAGEGRFADAVHLLLFRSIEDIQTNAPGAVPKSLTAREIGALRQLPPRPRSAQAPIIEIVERSFFGARGVDADQWRAARASYETFAFGEAWA